MKKLAPIFWLYRYYSWLEKNYRAVLWVSLLFCIVGTFYSYHLYKNLRTDMEELLPETAESVRDVKSVTKRVGGFNHLSVVIESSDREAGRKFQKDIAEKFATLPADTVARVQYHIRDEQEFFKRNKSLYIDLSDWEDIKKYVHNRIRFERRNKKEAFSLELDDEDDSKPKRPEYDFDALKNKYDQKAAAYTRFDDGLFESRDGKTHVVLAFLSGKVTDMALNQKLSETARGFVSELNPKSYAPDMVVGLSGDVQNVVEEQKGLIEDLITSSVIVVVLVGLSMLIYFRSFWGVYALCASLFAGTAWTFGLCFFLVGYLNANTAFLGSIVIGNGINFGIIMLARYLEERRRGLDSRDALPRSIGFTAQATWTAAVAAGLAYGSLVLTDFRGFNQFGVIGGMGMVLCWLSSFVTLPAMLMWIENKGWIKVRIGGARPIFARWVSKAIQYAYKPIAIATMISIVFSVYFVSKLSGDSLESDFSKLRNKESILHGSGYWGKKVDAVFERYLTPTVILTTDPKDAQKVVEALQSLKYRDGENSPISDFKSINDFLPKDQAKKIKTIAEIKKMLSPQVLKHLSDEDKKLVDELLPSEPPTPLVLSDLPEGIASNFRELDGSLGKLVHVYPIMPVAPKDGDEKNKSYWEKSFWNGKEVVRFAETIRESVKIAGVTASIAGQPPLSADMISAVTNDGPKATLFALIAVVVLVILLYPSWVLSRSILGALFIGILWMGAVIGAFDLKINFLNFIALPITFGIGVDYAVNIFSRYRQDGATTIGRVIENTGGAVALCSWTTIIGYSSLLLAGSQAFFSFGVLAVLGELTCVVAALIALPSFWVYSEESKKHTEPFADNAVPMGKG